MMDRRRAPSLWGLSVSRPSIALLFLLLLALPTNGIGHLSRSHDEAGVQDVLFEHVVPERAHSFDTQDPVDGGISDTINSIPDAQSALLEAIGAMQSTFYEIWIGTWPRAIDWTAAVLGTHISATLRTLTSSPTFNSSDVLFLDNIVNQYFLQTSTYYFGENAFSIRQQAYDDMLWVVLGWLENIKLINLHSRLHYPPDPALESLANDTSWQGVQFTAAAAHRARIFYELASHGWDTVLCNGGMTWNPDLTPYKNAITNELYISASVSMYLYFPGDDNLSPFSTQMEQEQARSGVTDLKPAKPHDLAYLDAAVAGYQWLKNSNMTNKQGLYVDGFHIRGWEGGESNGTRKCDERNEMVYTYNQGVVLTGLRGLWIATGAKTYLIDGHSLILSVIEATGWGSHDKKWKGLGRDGVMEEACDAEGDCSQNGHTFKGIFFHHLTEFCRPIDPAERNFTMEHHQVEASATAEWHGRECARYFAWISHNARAAYVTRNEKGLMGMWWGQKYPTTPDEETESLDQEIPAGPRNPAGAVDYRNAGVPKDEPMWWSNKTSPADEVPPGSGDVFMDAVVEDVNDRGRGRTVETQSGGIAVLRAYMAWRNGQIR